MLVWQPLWLEAVYVVTDVLNAGINDTVSTDLLYNVRAHIARMGSLDGKGLRRNDLAKHGCAKVRLQAILRTRSGLPYVLT
jgi:hypothetical protein